MCTVHRIVEKTNFGGFPLRVERYEESRVAPRPYFEEKPRTTFTVHPIKKDTRRITNPTTWTNKGTVDRWMQMTLDPDHDPKKPRKEPFDSMFGGKVPMMHFDIRSDDHRGGTRDECSIHHRGRKPRGKDKHEPRISPTLPGIIVDISA